MKLNELFILSYGTKLDLNKMIVVDESCEKFSDTVNFVSRTEKHLGVSARVRKKPNLEPYESGLITVALGGSVLSSFVQQEPFYTGQNMMVLTPIKQMTLQEKIFYCICIKKNHYRYTAYGREANRTLNALELPENIPEWVYRMSVIESIDSKPSLIQEINLHDRKWLPFRYDDKRLFKIERGRGPRKKDMVRLDVGKTPFITSIDDNNGLTGMVMLPPQHMGNVITVNRNGSVGEAFYQRMPFCSTEDVHVFKPNFKLNQYRAMFLISLIHKEQYRYSFGRKWGLKRMNESIIRLPVDESNNPDWQFMEDYIKSLPYSSNLEAKVILS